MTVCNMAIEAGARAGLVAVDEKTIDYVKGRPVRARRRGVEGPGRGHWRTLHSDPARSSTPWSNSTPRRSARRSPGAPRPRWCCPSRTACPTPTRRRTPSSAAPSSARWPTWAWSRTSRHGDIHVDKVFIGSCTNSRIEDMREAAAALVVPRRRRVAPNVKLALVVPGSGLVKAQAEAEGLHEVFKAAGFEWRDPAAAMCLAMNADRLEPGERCIHQQPQLRRAARAPAAAPTGQPGDGRAAALHGHFVDVRRPSAKEPET